MPASESTPDLAAGEPGREPGGRRLRVLVLDDESVRGAMRAALSLLGHDVVIVGDSRGAFEATDAAQHDGVLFDAIFVDLTMPEDLAGSDVIARLIERRTGAKLIVMSGYSIDRVMGTYREHGLSAGCRSRSR